MTPNNQYDHFISILLKWNARVNLTAITDPAEIQVKHIEDSLALLPSIKQACSLLDLGSGAGFPGIPLKIARPDLRVVLVEATRKKVSFLQSAIVELGLVEIAAECGRAEDTSLSQRLGTFDIVVSRATWKLAEFISLALPYLGAG